MTTDRGALFNKLVAAELEKLLLESGRSARDVASAIGTYASVLLNYTSGRRPIPISILCDVCEVLGERPYTLVIRAYDKLGPVER
jgi:hypothetical protein